MLLDRKPVLLILIGSDLSMMEALNDYSRPFHQRSREMVVGPLNPADLASMLDLDPTDAIDATLVTGGVPLICVDWPAGTTVWDWTNDIEIDIVGADRAPIAHDLLFVGSITWLDRSPFDQHDLTALLRHRAALTDQPIPTVAVSRNGITCPGIDAAFDPTDLIAAWSHD